MPLKTKPEDEPGVVRFQFTDNPGQVQIGCRTMPQDTPPYQVLGGSTTFASLEAFKAAAIEAGMTPAVAEDRSRSFNATARQLTELGFTVQLPQEQA